VDGQLRIPDERFSCQSCGRCCTRWTITADETKAEQLRRLDWVDPDPFIKRSGEGDSYRIKMVDGRCFFLDDDDRCRIHSKVSYNAKPEGCKAFPLLVGQVAGNTHLRLSFYCPAVTANSGKRLRDQQRWIQSTLKAAGDVERKAPLSLDPELELTLRDLEAIEGLLARLLEEREHPVEQRLAAGAAVLARLRQRVRQEGKSALKPTLHEAESAGLTLLAEEGREGGRPARAGPVLSLYFGNDTGPGVWSRMVHFFRVRLFNIGLASLRSELLGAKASWGAIRKVDFQPAEVSDRLVTRYLLHKLLSRRILSGELTLVEGWNLLAAAYGVINVLARLRAAHGQRGSVNEDDVSNAIQAADLLVMEHTALYHEGVISTLAEAVLAQEHLCASILARVSPPTRGETR
jgi:Fe-S-cluster containining protein